MGHKRKIRNWPFYYSVRGNTIMLIQQFDKSNTRNNKEFHVKY